MTARTGRRDRSDTVVTICIPTFNNSVMLLDALRSSSTQTHENLDIWVVDNKSTDDTEHSVRNFMLTDSRVHYIRQSENVGMPRNFNKCLETGRGEFLIVLCTDDMLDERCVGRLLDCLISNPSAVFAAAARKFVDSKLGVLRVVKATSTRRELHGPDLIAQCVARGNFIGEPSAVMMRRSAVSRGFNVDYSQLLDYEMWLHLGSKGSLILLPDPLCFIRQHGEQLTLSNYRSGRLIDEKKRLFHTELLPIASTLPFWCKIRWDIRMVASVARVRLFNGPAANGKEFGVFYAKVFKAALFLSELAWPLVRAWIRRGHHVQ